eukprot:NODE_12838_length_1200_cov_6.109040.p1 GENE.NODE_12838_length_1200_cov_6.109040~~NODE_12838_length_1200_cov_6.109040.p1  ORF type:complete len:224 (-),score=71.59 NODE_12838_length_1200_cov_6.109040:528-1112(-)
MTGRGIIAVGTANAGKLASVTRALSSYPKLALCEIRGAKVASGVAEQPMTIEETTQGAKNRAVAALCSVEGATLSIGLESGVFATGGSLFELTACPIHDVENFHVGYSCAWELPKAVQAMIVDKGMDLSQAINACGICDDPQIGEKGGALGLMTGGRVTRPDYMVQSLQMAILTMNPLYYACSGAVPLGVNDGT